MGDNSPVRRREFDLYRSATDRRLDLLEGDLRRVAGEHDTDMDGLASAAEERRRWTWQQVVAAVSAAAVVGALALQAAGR